VRLVEVCGTNVGAALLAEPVKGAEDASSDAGTLNDWLLTGVVAGDAEVPIDPVPDGVMPEAEGVMLAEAGAVGVGPVEDRTSEVGTPDEVTPEVGIDTEPVGTTPDEGSTPEETPVGTTPEEGSIPEDETPVGTTPEEGSTPEDETPVGTTPDDGSTPEDGRISDAKLEGNREGMMVGSLVGMPEPADGDTEETMVGRRLASLAVGRRVGAVEPAPVPEGVMPDASGTADGLVGPSEIMVLVAAASEVGIGPEPRG
jgi:hypothetical protein